MLLSAMSRSKSTPCSRASASFHSLSMRRLVAGEERPDRVRDERQRPARIAPAVARGVEPPQRLDRLLERAVAALRVGAALRGSAAASRRSRRPRSASHSGRSRSAGASRTVRLQRSMTCLPALHRLVDEVPEVRVQLRRAAGEVDGVRAGAVERREAGVDRLAVHHLVGAVGPGVDVAVPAGHVAELAEVDLEDLERRGGAGAPPSRGEGREQSPACADAVRSTPSSARAAASARRGRARRERELDGARPGRRLGQASGTARFSTGAARASGIPRSHPRLAGRARASACRARARRRRGSPPRRGPPRSSARGREPFLQAVLACRRRCSRGTGRRARRRAR